MLPERNFYFQPDEDIPAFLNKRPGKDAGYDLFASDDTWVMPFQTVNIKTNLHVHTPEGCTALVCSRSGNAKRGWLTHIGVGDHGYSGQYSATVTNLHVLPRRIKKGERIAQIVFVPFYEFVNPTRIRTEYEFDALVHRLSDSDRRAKSHNSSGR